MVREYRGKCKEGVWRYGFLWITKGGFFHVIRTQEGEDFEVDPKTVGQFTGYVDTNGIKIFEGDINMYGVVIFEQGRYLSRDLSKNWFVQDLYYSTFCEITGNIHEQ